MKKIITALFLFLLALTSINLPAPVYASAQYDYRIAEKSPDAGIKAGDSVILWVKIQNTGQEQWEMENSAHPLRLGTADPRDHSSLFRYAEKWLSDNRIRATQKSGDIMEFGFHIQAPSYLSTGTYRECFYPVIEHKTWIEKDPICWNIYVTGNPASYNYRAEGVDDYVSLNMDKNETAELIFSAKNTGSETWYQGGSYPVHLATTSPRDRSSDFYYSEWLNYNRPAALVENSVPPGAIGHFKFMVKVPSSLSAQTYYEKFWLVAENRQWLPDDSSLLTLAVKVNDNGDDDDDDDEKDYSEKYSSIETSQDEIEADGDDEAAIQIELRDKNDDPINNVWIDLIVREIDIYDRDETYYQYTIRTDSNGKAKYDFSTDTEADYEFSYAYNDVESDESVTVEAYDPDGDEDKDFSDEYSDIAINKSYIEPDGDEEARIDITLRDHDDDPIKNEDIDLIVLERKIDASSWKESDYDLDTNSSGKAYKYFTTSREADYYFTFEYNGDRARHWVSLKSYEDDDDDNDDNDNNDFEPDNSYIEVNRTKIKTGDYAMIEIGVHDGDDDPMEDEKVIIFGERCDVGGGNCKDIDDIIAYTDDSGVVEYKYYYYHEAEFELTYEVDDEKSGQYINFEFYDDDDDNDDDDYDVNNSYEVPVLSLSYIPIDRSDNVETELMNDWDDEDLDNLRDYIDEANKDLIYYLEKGSAYHGYDDSSADRALDYYLVDEEEILDELPESSQYEWPDSNDKMIDYYQVLEDDVDICKYVDDDGVQEVWLWAYDPKDDEPLGWESNMMMGYNIDDEWNYSSYGNVSNSEQRKDMPICDNTYTVYTYHYGKDLGEALASHTRQFEAVLNYIDGRDNTAQSNWDDLLFWGKFVGGNSSNEIIRPGCGSTDYAPNNQGEFDYDNTREVSSDCQNWEPDGGDKENISCKTWGGTDCDQFEEDGDNVAYLVWWMQNLPGIDNDVYDDDYKIKNWWDFIGGFDEAIDDKSLTY